MIRLYLPARSPRVAEEEWRHAVGFKWKEGHSAYAFAHTWFGSNPYPPEVASVLETERRFARMEVLVGLVEYETTLAGRGPGSHSDAVVVAKQMSGDLAIVAVEAKVSERFGDDNIEDWLAAGGSNRELRLDDLFAELEIPFEPEPLNPIRYQLLHRTVAALKEARRFNATDAVMLVHSFSYTNEWLEDYARFAAVLNAAHAEPGRLVAAGTRRGVRLWLGWASGANPAAG